jgi:hypothetical protein
MMSTYKKIDLGIARVQVHGDSDLVLSGISDETLVIREIDVRSLEPVRK